MVYNKLGKLLLVGAGFVLIPIGILVLVLGRILEIISKLDGPLRKWLVTQWLGLDGILAQVTMDAISLLVLLTACLVAGLLVGNRFVAQLFERLRKFLLLAIPGYPLIDSMVRGASDAEDQSANLSPVLVQLDDYSQMAFKVESVGDGKETIYLPGSPNPWSGAVVYVEAERVQKLDITMYKALNLMRSMGRGSEAVLRSAIMSSK